MGGKLDLSLDQPVEPLTRRERDVLILLAGDQSNQQIADQLFLSLNSVKWFTWQIYQKLGVKNRRQAVSRAANWASWNTACPRLFPATTCPLP